MIIITFYSSSVLFNAQQLGSEVNVNALTSLTNPVMVYMQKMFEHLPLNGAAPLQLKAFEFVIHYKLTI